MRELHGLCLLNGVDGVPAQLPDAAAFRHEDQVVALWAHREEEERGVDTSLKAVAKQWREMTCDLGVRAYAPAAKCGWDARGRSSFCTATRRSMACRECVMAVACLEEAYCPENGMRFRNKRHATHSLRGHGKVFGSC